MSTNQNQNANGNDNRRIAEAILPLVGGARNVTSVSHCMTRMRLGLAERSLVRDEELTALPEVLGVVEDDTYQIVLGPGKVARVTPELQALLEESEPAGEPAEAAADSAEPAGSAASAGSGGPGGPGVPGGSGGSPAPAPARTAEELAEEGAALKAARKEKNATPVKLMLRRVANIFVPLIPALIGCGIVSGIGGLLTNLAGSGSADWAKALVPALTAISSGFMSLIAVFVGVNTAREFGGSPVLGGAAAAVIVFPGVSDVSAFGHKLAAGQGGVLGGLFAALLAVYVEKWCRRRVPEALDVLVTPTVTVLVSGLVTLFGLMYLCGELSTGIGHAANWLLQHGGAAAGFLLGGLFLPLVMLGLHQALIPIHTTLIQQDGYTVLLPILAMAGAGQVGAAVAIYVKLRKNTSIRKTIKSTLPAGFLGVGEPLIYGVSLPLGRPFITACVGGAFGGGVVGLCYQLGTAVGSTAIGPSGWALFPLLKGNHGLGAVATIYALGLGVGYVAGFVATYFFGFSKQMLAELNVDPAERAADGGAEAGERAVPAAGPAAGHGPYPASEPEPEPAPEPESRSGSGSGSRKGPDDPGSGPKEKESAAA